MYLCKFQKPGHDLPFLFEGLVMCLSSFYLHTCATPVSLFPVCGNCGQPLHQARLHPDTLWISVPTFLEKQHSSSSDFSHVFGRSSISSNLYSLCQHCVRDVLLTLCTAQVLSRASCDICSGEGARHLFFFSLSLGRRSEQAFRNLPRLSLCSGLHCLSVAGRLPVRI